jgi:kynureninase
VTSREDAAALDAADPLAPLRARFELDEGDRIYVDGNSLGRLPLTARERIAQLVDDWAERLVTAWPDWIEAPSRVGDLLAGACLGAPPGTVLVADSTTVNLYKLAAAALAARPARRVLVTDAGEFPTDRYVLQGLGEVRLLESDPVHGPDATDVVAACAPGDVALVCLSLVSYRSGALADAHAITRAAQDGGAFMLWDLSHAAGAVEVELEAVGAELAVGCTYKYLNGGPGAPAFLYVRRDLQDELRSPIQGWFGQRDQFAMGAGYEPEDGIARFGAGTPPMLGLAAVEAAVELVGEAGIARIRAKAAALTDLAVALGDERLAPLGFELGSPRKAVLRGAHVSFRHRDAWRICQALIARANVVPDFRGPDSIRFGLPPLYTRFVDVWDAVDRTATLVAAGEHHDFPAELARVT